MRKLIVTLFFFLAMYSVPVFADTQNFNAYGLGTGLTTGAKLLVESSLAFPGFTLNSPAGLLQLDAPGYFGATNYELLGDAGGLTIDFNVAQSAFTIDLRDFQGYGGTDSITVYGSDDTTVLNTYSIVLNGSIINFTDMGESKPIGAVTLSEISGEGWSGILQDVTYNNTNTSVPEPTSLLLLGTGLGAIGLAAWRRKR